MYQAYCLYYVICENLRYIINIYYLNKKDIEILIEAMSFNFIKLNYLNIDKF